MPNESLDSPITKSTCSKLNRPIEHVHVNISLDRKQL